MLFSRLFQLYRSSKSIYPCLLGVFVIEVWIIFFPSYSLLSHITKLQATTFKKMTCCERGMNHIVMTSINLLNPFLNKPCFLHVCRTCLLKTLWEKEKLLVKSNFFFSHSVFYPSGALSDIFIKFEIVICKFNSFNWEEPKICHLGKS